MVRPVFSMRCARWHVFYRLVLTKYVSTTPCVLCFVFVFVCLVSTGVWEFISSQEACSIVNKYWSQGPRKACDALVAESVKRWNLEEDVVDDTTVVILFLRYPKGVAKKKRRSTGGAGAGGSGGGSGDGSGRRASGQK